MVGDYMKYIAMGGTALICLICIAINIWFTKRRFDSLDKLFRESKKNQARRVDEHEVMTEYAHGESDYIDSEPVGNHNAVILIGGTILVILAVMVAALFVR
jgi:hypothetical protein